jgi:hypothetical protein
VRESGADSTAAAISGYTAGHPAGFAHAFAKHEIPNAVSNAHPRTVSSLMMQSAEKKRCFRCPWTRRESLKDSKRDAEQSALSNDASDAIFITWLNQFHEDQPVLTDLVEKAADIGVQSPSRFWFAGAKPL